MTTPLDFFRSEKDRRPAKWPFDVPEVLARLEEIASLALALACHQDKLHVGASVLRVTRRWGLVTAVSPSGAESQSSEKIPREAWQMFG